MIATISVQVEKRVNSRSRCRRGEVRKDHDAEKDVQRFGDVVGRQERRGDDEQDRYDVERQQGITEANALRRRALVKAADFRLREANDMAAYSPIHAC